MYVYTANRLLSTVFFILKESGELFAFGNNEYGQLGLDENTQ